MEPQSYNSDAKIEVRIKVLCQQEEIHINFRSFGGHIMAERDLANSKVKHGTAVIHAAPDVIATGGVWCHYSFKEKGRSSGLLVIAEFLITNSRSDASWLSFYRSTRT